ncbi:MAG TPA: hypothetical protein VKX25_18670 [Bryobacteraceae bacterium]|jgi:hypothetical protein|nr:hypothetical protein [Bryobacteraceae bacterium]
MNKNAIATIVAVSCLEIILQLIALLLGLPAAIICGALLPPLSQFVFGLIDIQFRAWWPLLLQSAGASLGGVLLGWATLGLRWPLLFAPLAACVSAGVLLFMRRWQAEQCALCKHRLIGEIAFECPRCGLRVCERQCWNFMGCRCRMCEEHRVPIFTEDSRWWDRNFGARSSFGKCQLCQESAANADLRLCGNCGRPQCRDCWDSQNGICSRCQWTVPELPERLRDFLLETPHAQTSRGHS